MNMKTSGCGKYCAKNKTYKCAKRESDGGQTHQTHSGRERTPEERDLNAIELGYMKVTKCKIQI